MKLQRIMLAVKPWERGLPVTANHVRQLAESAGAEIQIVGSVFDAAVAARRDRGDAAAHETHNRTVIAARATLERLTGSMRDWGAPVTTRIVWGAPPYEAILAAAQDWQAGLLVVGTHERGTLTTRFTDTDWQLMRRVRCPLLLVKGGAFTGYRTILAALDPLHGHEGPSGLDRAVLTASRCVARACGSTVRAVYAYPGAEAFELASAVEVAPGILYGVENIEALHRRAVNELAVEFGIAPSEVDLVEGSPVQAIIDTASRTRAELVVVGAAQRRGLAAAVFGNTAELVAGELPCDVLIVPVAEELPAAAGVRSKVG